MFFLLNTQHAYKSYLYWTNRSADDGYGEAIHRMSLYDLSNVDTIDIGRKKIDKLVLDSPFLYWIDRETHKIERFSLSSTNSNHQVITIADLANNVTGM